MRRCATASRHCRTVRAETSPGLLAASAAALLAAATAYQARRHQPGPAGARRPRYRGQACAADWSCASSAADLCHAVTGVRR